jgi:hypothetical protein
MNRLALLGCAALVVSGCEVSAADGRSDYPDSELPAGRGAPAGGDAEFSVDWTIEGSHDPGACDDYEVDHASIVVEDDVGVVDEVDMPCEAFAYDAPPLPSGHYSATIVLRDARDRDVTDVADTDARVLQPGDRAYVTIDFTEDMFL